MLSRPVLITAISLSLISGACAGVELVRWSGPESLQRLSRAEAKVDFFELSNHFVSQDNKVICGLASSAIVLNALRLRSKKNLPKDSSSISSSDSAFLPKNFDPFFKKYTQNNLLNQKTKSKRQVLGEPIEYKGKKKPDFGLQLRQLAQVLTSHGAKVVLRVAAKGLSNKQIKDELIQNLSQKGDFVLVNYSRKSLGQPGGGHISPLGAYDKKSDSFLIMDVNPNKDEWVWVKTADLIGAMQTFDTVENRGYLLISDK